MLVVNYNGNKPIADYYKYSVNGNNNADIVRFVVKKIQNGLDLTNGYHIYAKCDNGFGFVDKAEITISKENEEEIYVDWHLLRKHTENASLKVSISFENIDSEIVWQTQIFTLKINSGVVADKEIANKYPTVLQDLQRQIDEIGGGGSSSVEIEKIWLTYDDKASIRTDHLGTYFLGNPFVNDSTRIWVNFKTTPIGAKIEDEIKSGRFVIRLDYPMKSRNIHLNYEEGGDALLHINPTDYGVGARSYCHNFKQYQTGFDRNEKRNEILKRSLIFIEPSDIKVNRYGEKHIHKKISLFEYITNICEFKNLSLYPITNEKIQEGQELFEFFESWLDGVFQIGIPTLNQNGLDCPQDLFNGGFVYKCYSRTNNGVVPNLKNIQNKVNGKKLNPAFTCYTPLYTKTRTNQISLISPYWNRHKTVLVYSQQFNEYVGGKSNFFTMFAREPLQNNSKRNYMVAKPRCAILNEDWENADYSFLKTFSQATQDIKLVCKAIRDVDDFGVNLMPIFRIKIGAK